MRGAQTGNAVLQNTPDREERSKDHNSISGVCRRNGCLQGGLRVSVGAGHHILAGVVGAPSRLQLLCRCGTWGGQIAKIPAVDQRAHARQHGTEVFVAHGTNTAWVVG